MSKLMRAGMVALVVVGIALALAAVKFGRIVQYHEYVIGPTSCMAPTINSGELIFVKPFDSKRDRLKRYEIILFRAPMPVIPEGIWVMRVLGLPLEKVEVRTNSVLINGSALAVEGMPSVLRGRQWLAPQASESSANAQWSLGEDEVFVVGDNLVAANDSRYWGGLKLSNIIGVVEQKAKGKQLKLTLEPVLPVDRTVILRHGPKTEVNQIDQN